VATSGATSPGEGRVRSGDHPVIDPEEIQHARAWLAAAANDFLCAELEAVYDEVRRETERVKPVCVASGKCCRFEEYGHRLYVTGLEAAYTLARLPTALTHDVLDASRSGGGCPFQIDNLCSVHTIKPLGCRTYYCDKNAQEWQKDLTERMLEKIRAIHDRHALEYRYGEWRGMLGLLLEAEK
jgi:Fe-S-cluster containining protein